MKLRLRTSCGEMVVKYRVAVSGALLLGAAGSMLLRAGHGCGREWWWATAHGLFCSKSTCGGTPACLAPLSAARPLAMPSCPAGTKAWATMWGRSKT